MPIILNNTHVRDLLTRREKRNKKIDKRSFGKGACADFITKRDEIRNQYKFIISPSEVLSHGRWVERGVDRMQVAVNVTDILLQEIKRNVLRQVSGGSENALVDAITRLMEASLYQMPIEFNIEVTRNERQSMASKKRKTKQVIGSRGNKPDLMVRVFFKRSWNELAYLESGKWRSTEIKSHNDHNKLARFCVDGYVDMSKKINKNELNKFCITFGINITDEHFIVINGLLRENVLRVRVLNIHGISRTFIKKSNSTQQNEDSSEDSILSHDLFAYMSVFCIAFCGRNHIFSRQSDRREQLNIDPELKKKFVKVEAENAKLKQALEKHEIRIKNPEQKEKSDTNALSTKDVFAISNLRCDDTPASDTCQETKTQCFTSSICIKTKSSEDKEIEFLDHVHKEQISNEIRERNREKKLRSQDLSSNNSSEQSNTG
ncbi:hypothetical protein Glove_35g25 [Diversispora epigaea]|uniref:Uncharacterized protein n=1 Tax=Diversispora epigaea TaxID=1348612 RepID=A0A397JGD3_9GLOM|nr:hypothetical protein Glove_35g25 [Diversispora epigaea]